MDQARFRLLSGSSELDCLELGDFKAVRDIMEQRLMNSLCVTTVPTVTVDEVTSVDPLWDQLLAYALSISVMVQNDQGIQSENMRNYSYQLREYANTWQMLMQKANDLLNKFNACPSGIKMQRDDADFIYRPGFHHIGFNGLDYMGNPYELDNEYI